MSFQEKLTEIDRLQDAIENHGKLGNELLQKINYKFRLDWNYYSNRMEGNTLTLDETKSVMIGNINVHNKPLKDVLEMKGHDEVVQTILKMGKGELDISESRIKKLHEEIMYEDGPTEKAMIGQWKLHPNHVINYKDEKFDFIDPSEIKEKMHDLVNWVNAEKNKVEAGKNDALHPVVLAFDFHLRYLTIHPFYDGNGRTGRILTNLILIRYGYPPIYVKDNEKAMYYRYLADVQGYGADRYLFFDLMSDYLIRSMNIVVDAIAGKEIEDLEDLDKKIQLLERELSFIDANNEVKVTFSKDVFIRIFNEWVADLLVKAIPVIERFNKFFTAYEHTFAIQQIAVFERIADRPIAIILGEIRDKISKSNHLDHAPLDVYLQAVYRHFAKGGLQEFDCSASLRLQFSKARYEVYVDDFSSPQEQLKAVKKYEHLLHHSLNTDEITDVTTMLGNTIYKQIDFHTYKKGIRR